MTTTGLVIALSLAAALGFAASSSLKHVSAGRGPDLPDLRGRTLGRFVRATVAHRLWLAGIGCDVLALGLQIVALHLGALSLVQPLLIAGLVFSLIFRRLHDHLSVTGRQLAWALLLCAALGGFVALAAGAHSPSSEVDRLPAAVAAAAGGVLAAVCVVLGRKMSGPAVRAALLGVALGVVFAGTAALLKALTDIAARNPAGIIVSWQLYAVIPLGAAGLLLNQLAFKAGPLAASLPATATVDPLASIAIGVAVYDEHIPRVDDTGVVLIALLLLLGVAVIQMIRASPDLTATELPSDVGPPTASGRHAGR